MENLKSQSLKLIEKNKNYKIDGHGIFVCSSVVNQIGFYLDSSKCIITTIPTYIDEENINDYKKVSLEELNVLPKIKREISIFGFGLGENGELIYLCNFN